MIPALKLLDYDDDFNDDDNDDDDNDDDNFNNNYNCFGERINQQASSSIGLDDRLQFDKQKKAKFSKTSNCQIMLSSSSICA